MSIVESWLADKAPEHAGDSVAKCEERTYCDVGFPTVEEMQCLEKVFNWTKRSYSCNDCIFKRDAQN